MIIEIHRTDETLYMYKLHGKLIFSSKTVGKSGKKENCVDKLEKYMQGLHVLNNLKLMQLPFQQHSVRTTYWDGTQ